MSSLKYWLWLTGLKGLRNQTVLALLRHFLSPEDVFYADPDEIMLAEGMTREQAALLENHRLDEANRILGECQRLGFDILTIQDVLYPGRLKNIYDPPVLLYSRGRMPLVDEELSIAVVGTRDCTPYGESTAEKLGYGFATGGAVVVSGLAKGIDAAAARGALRGGGRVIGVVGNGLDVHYPYESRYLYEDVAAAGVLLSEYPPGTEPAKGHFPARNRILSGLSLASVVVEAPERSGALITAETAMEQGREVFAVPGPADAPTSVGCNRLIQDGAGLVMSAADVLREYEAQFPDKLSSARSDEKPATLGYQARQKEDPKAVPPTLNLTQNDRSLTDDQITLLKALDEEQPIHVDDLIEKTGIPTRRVLSALMVLELDNLVEQHSGKHYTRAVTLTE